MTPSSRKEIEAEPLCIWRWMSLALARSAFWTRISSTCGADSSSSFDPAFGSSTRFPLIVCFDKGAGGSFCKMQSVGKFFGRMGLSPIWIFSEERLHCADEYKSNDGQNSG